MSLSRNSEGGIGDAAFLAAASFDAAKLEETNVELVRERYQREEYEVKQLLTDRKMKATLVIIHQGRVGQVLVQSTREA